MRAVPSNLDKQSCTRDGQHILPHGLFFIDRVWLQYTYGYAPSIDQFYNSRRNTEVTSVGVDVPFSIDGSFVHG